MLYYFAMEKENKTILSQDIIPLFFVFLSMLSATAILLVCVMIPPLLRFDIWYPGTPIMQAYCDMTSCRDIDFAAKLRIDTVIVLTVILISLLVFMIGIRKRVVFFDEKTREIFISWGSKFPIIFRKIPANNWDSITIAKEFPVAVYSYKGMSRVSRLPPQWRLLGKTKSGKKINLGRFKTESDAESWKRAILK